MERPAHELSAREPRHSQQEATFGRLNCTVQEQAAMKQSAIGVLEGTLQQHVADERQEQLEGERSVRVPSPILPWWGSVRAQAACR